MRLQFGEGAAAVLHGDRLIVNFDHEGPGFVAMLDADGTRTVANTAHGRLDLDVGVRRRTWRPQDGGPDGHDESQGL